MMNNELKSIMNIKAKLGQLMAKMDINKSKVKAVAKDLQFKKIEDISYIGLDDYAKLRDGVGYEVDINDLSINSKNPIFKVSDMFVSLYIKQQYYPPRSEYKYHVCWCDTLQKRKEEKKIGRYVLSKRRDQRFNVTKIDANTQKIIEENIFVDMKICRDCLKKLNYKGYRNASYPKKVQIYESFSLDEFQNTVKQKGFKKDEVKGISGEFSQGKNEYPINWNVISRRYRKLKGYKCERCGFDGSDNPRYIQVHHINSCKNDVRDENLIALCESCHNKEHSK
ncbi:MAG: HNH endonuclease signature motif containing protein [Clostridium sp.]